MAHPLSGLEVLSQLLAMPLGNQQLKVKLLQALLLGNRQPHKQHQHLAHLMLVLVLASRSQRHQQAVASVLDNNQLLLQLVLALALLSHNQLPVLPQVGLVQLAPVTLKNLQQCWPQVWVIFSLCLDSRTHSVMTAFALAASTKRNTHT